MSRIGAHRGVKIPPIAQEASRSVIDMKMLQMHRTFIIFVMFSHTFQSSYICYLKRHWSDIVQRGHYE